MGKNQPPSSQLASVRSEDRRRVTSYDVARLAGVSQSAVSRCFKPGGSASAKTREKVLAAAKELGWQPNALARGLITQRSNIVAVLISGSVNLYYPEVLFTLTQRLSDEGLRVMLFTVDSEDDVEPLVDQIAQFQVDAVISASHMNREHAERFEETKTPLVFFNRFFRDRSSDVVFCDPEPQTRMLIQRLTDLGHQRFGILAGPPANMVSQTRVASVLAAIEASGGHVSAEANGDYTYESGAKAVHDLLDCNNPPTAIICANDMMALGLIDEARTTLRLDIPRDLSVTGFDGIATARLSSYDLTTIRQPIGRMCDAAVAILLEQRERPERTYEKRVFEGLLIDGATISSPRSI
ncbi:MAG: LacI family DNA-binding transcriptional regulator [Pseudomonadota bacterium]